MIDLKGLGEPLIHTERLLLHRHRRQDFDDSAALWKDPIVTRFIGGNPSTDEECWARFLRAAGHWTVLGFGYFAVREKSTGDFIGEVGMSDFHRAIEPPFGGDPEVGWVLKPSTHGKGFATEAVNAVLAFGEERLRPKRFVCMIDPANTASIRVAEKVGFREYQRAAYHGSATILFERRRG